MKANKIIPVTADVGVLYNVFCKVQCSPVK